MALRVLLADESSTIKKVIQLSLQDFNVDVKSVTVGLDVLSVAKTFRPDVVLADVLLAKRSGYEVCHDLKNDAETDSIPVVLMWSGFMEIDEQKARLCGADRRLEKPFDASTLRQIVQELVSRTQSNPASAFLQFPTLPPFDEAKRSSAGSNNPGIHPAPGSPNSTPSSISKAPGLGQASNPVIPSSNAANDAALIIDELENESSDEWVQQPINPNAQQAAPQAPSFPLPSHKTKEDDFTEFSLTQQPISQKNAANPRTSHPATHATPSQDRSVTHDRTTAPAQGRTAPPSQTSPQNLNPQIPEAMLREEIQKWLAHHLPDMAERLIRDEINRLLQESEKTIQGP